MPITTVKSIEMTVADLDRAIDFYTTVLSFTKIAVGEASVSAEASPSEQLSRRKLRLKDERNCSSTLTSDYAREVP